MSTNSNLPVTFQERIREKLFDDIAGLIPPNEVDALVASAIATFKLKELPKLVDEELAKFFRERITEIIRSPEWQGKYSPEICATELGPMMQEMMVKAAPRMFARLMESQVQQVISSLPVLRNY